jgi:plastocyanin
MRRRLTFLVGAALAIVGVGVGFSAGPAAAGDASVSIFGGASSPQGYDPVKVVIDKRSSVHWTNNGSVDHTVTKNGGGFNSGVLDPGDTFDKTFKKPKVYKYHCSIHPNMRARVKVVRP